MTSGSFIPVRNPGESDEQFSFRLNEALVAEDWETQFLAHLADFRFATQALEEESDPNRREVLIGQRESSLIQGMGIAMINEYVQRVIAERQQFESDFGNRIQF